MGTFFKSNDFKTDYKKRPHDEYKALLEKLDDETKRKFALQRALILAGVILLVVAGIIVLAVTGIGTNKTESAGNILGGTDKAKISFLSDATPGVIPSLAKELNQALQTEAEVSGLTESSGKASNTSYKQLETTPDIVILQLLLSNCETGEDPEGILEANIDGLTQQGCLVYLVNYPSASFAENSVAVKLANQYIAKASKEKSILLLDAADYFKGLLEQNYTEEDLFSEDGVHLTETGSRELGTFIAGGLLSDAGLN